MTAYFSEISITGESPQEFLEIAVAKDTDTSGYSVVHYMGNGAVYLTYSFGTVVQTVDGKDVYTIDDSDPDFPVITGEGNEMGNIYPDDAFALVDDSGTVIQFVSFYDNNITATDGPANGMTSTMIGTPGFGQSLQSDNDGSSYYNQSSPNRNSIPCFAENTQILTEHGYKAATDLCLGDRVVTVDNGLQPIIWTRQYNQDLSGADLTKKPIRIRAGALGELRPATDLVVSPQHRIVVSTPQQVSSMGKNAALAPAKSLAELPDIDHMARASRVKWVHFACANHEVVIANGCEVETLLLSPSVLSGIPKLQRDGLRTCAIDQQKKRGKARQFFTVRQAQRLIRNACAFA